MDTVFATQDGNGGAAVKGGNHASQKGSGAGGGGGGGTVSEQALSRVMQSTNPLSTEIREAVLKENPKFRRQFNKFVDARAKSFDMPKAEARTSMLTQVGMPKSIVMGVVSKNPALIEKVNSY